MAEPRPRVLFAEDEAERNRRFTDALRLEGLDVDTVSTVVGCIERLRAEPYDLLVLDVMMPLGDGEAWEGIDPIDAGVALLTRWRDGELPGLPENLPVIVLTGTTRHRELLEALGVSDYLEKPCSLPWLLEAVRAAVRTEEGRP